MLYTINHLKSGILFYRIHGIFSLMTLKTVFLFSLYLVVPNLVNEILNTKYKT